MKMLPSVLFAATLLATPAAFANMIVNGNFAQGAPASGCAAGVTNLSGWTVTSGNIDIISGASGCGGITPSQGNYYFVDLTGSFAPAENDVGTISQSFTTTAGASYRLTFYFGGNPQWQYVGYPNDGPIKSMNVLVDGSVVGNYSVDTTGASLTDAQWTLETLNFVATGPTTGLSFQSLNGITSPSDFGPLVDGVNVHPVPEPGTLALMGLGLLGLGFLVARKRQSRYRVQ